MRWRTRETKVQTTFEGKLVQYYELFFFQKNRVEREVDYIEKLMEEHGIRTIESILDVGCGTGAHAFYFAVRGKFIDGIDLSEDMIMYAKNHHLHQRTTYCVQNICLWSKSGKKQYDACISLSHVIGYQLSNDDVEHMLLNVNHALKLNGIFIFNFYHMAGILSNGNQPLHNDIMDKGVRVQRFSTAKLDVMKTYLDLEYFYFVKDNINDFTGEIHVQEKMRCFTMNEIKFLLKTTGFEVMEVYEHMSYEEISEKTWNACVVCRKCNDM